MKTDRISLKCLLTLVLPIWALVPGGANPVAADLSEFEIYPDDSILYRAYDGTINGRIPIRVFLCREEDRWEGSYFYKDRRMPLGLFDEVGVDETRDPQGQGKVVLREGPMIGAEGTTGRWEGVFDDEARSFEGTWHSPDGMTAFPIELRESSANDSLPAVFYRFSSSWTLARGSIETRKEYSAVVIQFEGEDEPVRRINATIRDAAANSFDSTDLPEPEPVIRRDGNPFAALELAIRATPIDPEHLVPGLSGSDIQELVIQPVHNEGGYVTVRLYSRYYQGGAHSNYTDHHLTFETATGRLLDLRRDILNPGYEEPLARAAEVQLRQTLGLEPGASLSAGPLDVDEIELNENWFLTVGGIGFSHDPYEVASFAVGFVSYVLPWEDLRPWLRERALRPLSGR